jgi:hypothetical protein
MTTMVTTATAKKRVGSYHRYKTGLLSEAQVEVLNTLELGWMLVTLGAFGGNGAKKPLPALQRRGFVEIGREMREKNTGKGVVLVRLTAAGREARDELQRRRCRKLRKKMGL